MTDGVSPGAVVGHYRLEHRIGVGGMAEVFLAVHTRLESRHAIKFINLPGASVHDRLLQEGRIQARLRHPNIVHVTDVVELAGRTGLVMEFVDGIDLATWMTRKGRPEFDTTLQIFSQLLSALHCAHAQGVLHRDLKPANILLRPTDGGLQAKITDFGIAKLLETPSGSVPLTMVGQSIGTPGYMAPEQLKAPVVTTVRSDIFSLGTVLYEMIAGTPAFVRTNPYASITATREHELTELEELVPECPTPILAAVTRALQPDPADRFSSCAEFVRALFPGRSDLLSLHTTGRFATGPTHLEINASENSLTTTLPETPPSQWGFRIGLLTALAIPLLLGGVLLSTGVIRLGAPEVADAPTPEQPAGTAATASTPTALPEVGPVETPEAETPGVETPGVETPEVESSRVESPRSRSAEPPLQPTREPVTASPPPAAPSSPVTAVESAPPPVESAPVEPPPTPNVTTPPPEAPAGPTIAGRWDGSLPGRPFQLVLVHEGGDEVTGTLIMLRGAKRSSVRLSGTLNGARVELKDSSARFRLAAQVSGGRMEGSSFVMGGKEKGSWSADRS